MTENPLVKALKGRTLVLASGSPRRKKFFEELGVPFEIRLKPVEEIYPENLEGAEISKYLAELKASVFKSELEPNQILITSDTVVWHQEESLAKATDSKEAFEMLQKLSGDWHEVITSVCFTTTEIQKTVSATTEVKFANLNEEEIHFYIEQCQPFDKAGAYGIQEWLGAIAIEELKGSYNNVVGLPTHLVYSSLLGIVN